MQRCNVPLEFCLRPRGLGCAIYVFVLCLTVSCSGRTALRTIASTAPGSGVGSGGEAESVGGSPDLGGTLATGYGGSTGGAIGTGGRPTTGGSVAAGGTRSLGGTTGGSTSTRVDGGPAPAGGTVFSSGGRTSVTGGMTTTGGYLATGGVKIDRGDASAGGTTGNGGSARDGGIILPDVAILLPDVAILRDGPAGDGLNAQGTPAILPDGYVKLNTGTVVMAGHISSYESGSGSSIMLTYVTNSFCASGTVAADNTYNSWAGAGFNVNQAESGASGSSSSLVLTGSSVSITYLNRASSSLEFQMYDGSNYWCSYLPPAPKSITVTIPFSGLSTQCWTSGGQVFTSGTPITAVQLVVGGSASTPTPFDFCFQGLTVH